MTEKETTTALQSVAALAPVAGGDILKRLHDPEFIQLMKDTYCKGASDQEFALALQTARHLKLDPVSRQIFFVKRFDSSAGKAVMACQVSIDGLRLIAERTGKYAGQMSPQWCGKDGRWRDVWLEERPPAAARVGVLRHDFQQPCFAVARYGAYVQTKKGGEPNSMWKKMPDLMLAKCAEALALRKAFPAEMSGAYTDDEMGQAENPPMRVVEQKKPAGWLAAEQQKMFDEYRYGLANVTTKEEMRPFGEMAANLPSAFKNEARELWRETVARLDQPKTVPRETPEEPKPPAEPKADYSDVGPPPMDESVQAEWGFDNDSQ